MEERLSLRGELLGERRIGLDLLPFAFLLRGERRGFHIVRGCCCHSYRSVHCEVCEVCCLSSSSSLGCLRLETSQFRLRLVGSERKILADRLESGSDLERRVETEGRDVSSTALDRRWDGGGEGEGGSTDLLLYSSPKASQAPQDLSDLCLETSERDRLPLLRNRSLDGGTIRGGSRGGRR